MIKGRSVFICSECGYQSAKWLGRCPGCQSWNTLEEHISEEQTGKEKTVYRSATGEGSEAVPYSEVGTPEYLRTLTGIGELDRVLGGGLVAGSVILISGEPGIGKSTLLMQLSGKVSGENNKVLYVSGEESRGQLKMRAERLGINGDGLYFLTDPDIDVIMKQADEIKPSIIIADSIQTISDSRLPSSAGSVTQVRETTARLIAKAKSENISVFLVGHINKEGGIAGPKVLEHMVDAVLYFEGDRQFAHRIVRAVKNRFGSTNEIGVFEMGSEGLEEIPNPSEVLLSDRPKDVSGTCAVALMEGSRPIIAELQALATPTVFPAPRRTSNGVDYNRLYMILAVLEKRLSQKFSLQDIYVNVIGGLKIDEPAADLATVLALVSSISDIPVPQDLIAIGEVGLAGEVRAVSDIEQRVNEARRLGFGRILAPKRNCAKMKDSSGIIPVSSVYEVLRLLKA